MVSRIMALHFAGTCSVCGMEIPAKIKAHWNAELKMVTCLGCYGIVEQVLTNESTDQRSQMSDSSKSSPSLAELQIPESVVAGASARYNGTKWNLACRFTDFTQIVTERSLAALDRRAAVQ